MNSASFPVHIGHGKPVRLSESHGVRGEIPWFTINELDRRLQHDRLNYQSDWPSEPSLSFYGELA